MRHVAARFLALSVGLMAFTSFAPGAAPLRSVAVTTGSVNGPVLETHGAYPMVMQPVDSTDYGVIGSDAYGGVFSPDGAKLAIACTGAPSAVCTIDHASPGHQHAVASMPAIPSSVAWSPDGLSLAVLTQGDPYPYGAVWVVPAAGGSPRLLVEGTSDFRATDNVTWSPGGDRLAFVGSARPSGAWGFETTAMSQIYTVAADGSGEPELFGVPYEKATSGESRISWFEALHWLSNGRIAATWTRNFAGTDQPVAQRRIAIVTVGPGDRDPTVVYDSQATSDNQSIVQGAPVWSPDELTVLMQTPGPLAPHVIEIVAATGTSRLTPLQWIHDWQPCPQGRCATWATAEPIRFVFGAHPVVGQRVGITTLSEPECCVRRFGWTRDSRQIPGATENWYRVMPEDAGHELRVWTSNAVPSADPAVRTSRPAQIPAAAIVAPRVFGAGRVGVTLRGTRGQWVGRGYRTSTDWLRDGHVVRGATHITFRLGRSDRGHIIALRVTASRAGWPSVAVETRGQRIR